MSDCANPCGKLWLSPDRAVRAGLAVTLLLAAVLKSHQLATQLVVGQGWLGSRWLLAVVVQFEFAFGTWLLFGFLPRITQRASILLFSAFACVALYKGLSGEPTCGCLGNVQTSPWVTLAFDCLAVALLIGFPPRSAVASLTSNAARTTWAAIRWYVAYASLALTLMAASGSAILRFEATCLREEGQIVSSDASVVILEPEQWIGKRFPLLRYLNIGRQIERGSWRVVFFHHNCPDCRRLLPQYVRQISHAATKTAFVELPPFGSSVVSYVAHLTVGKLNSDYQWFMRTPCSVWLKDAIVTQVAD